MKGIVLKTDEKIISGGMDNGIADVLISNKEFYYKLNFSGLNDTNMAHIWCDVDLQLGDIFTIDYDTISVITTPIAIKDYNARYIATDEDDIKSLNLYYRLKEELIEDGLL